jgi:predicted ribonuclease YlaK
MNSLKVRYNDLLEFDPITGNQKTAFSLWDVGENLVLAGSAGTGKTFIAMYLALESLLEKSSLYDRIIVVRSVVAVREVGYLPGKLEEKTAVFETPYSNIVEELFDDNTVYDRLVHAEQIQFETTSFIRGKTFERAIVIVDEMQNLNFHELDSVMTRIGENCRIIFCGDYLQSDFNREVDKLGLMKFLQVIDRMKDFTTVQFGWEDIVRSGIVRDYIMTKEMMGIS